MGESVSVPVLLVGSMDALRVLNRPEVTVVKAATLGEAIQKRGEIECPAEIAVLDMESGTRTDVVVAGLLMRNAGRSVVICQLTTLPLDLVRQLHEFTIAERNAGRVVRTELLLAEEAMERFGDITDVVVYFEREFLVE